ncbi:MAG TPA: hypothetical protein VIH43_02185 [Chthoniobacterales bacterium]|jgi:GTP cyclohydrolase III
MNAPHSGFGYVDNTLASVIAPPAVCAAIPKQSKFPAVAAATARIRLAVSGCSKCAVQGIAARKTEQSSRRNEWDWLVNSAQLQIAHLDLISSTAPMQSPRPI